MYLSRTIIKLEIRMSKLALIGIYMTTNRKTRGLDIFLNFLFTFSKASCFSAVLSLSLSVFLFPFFITLFFLFF